MAKKSTRNTREKIIDAAWKLFYRQGYDGTTVEEIIEESGTSRGSFYQHVLPGVVALAAQDGAQDVFQIAGQVGGKLLPAGGSVLLVEHVDDRVRLAQVRSGASGPPGLPAQPRLPARPPAPRPAERFPEPGL